MNKFIRLLTFRKAGLKFLIDCVLWAAITPLAYLLRLEENIFLFWDDLYYSTLLLIPFKLVIVLRYKLYLQSWQNVSVSDFYSLLKANAAATVVFFTLLSVGRYGIINLTIPLSVPVIEAGLMLIVLGGIRITSRVFFKYIAGRKNKEDIKRVVIAGAGDSGTMIAREMIRKPKAGMKPVAFLDDDPGKQKQRFMGIPVLGTIEDMETVVHAAEADILIIAMSGETGDVIRRVMRYAKPLHVETKILPSLQDLITGKVTINQIRNVDVEDLLRRKPVRLETGEIRSYIKGRRILVSGAGGSIGSEIVRQISRFDPEHVVLLGRGENSIHQLVREIKNEIPGLSYCIRIGDVRDFTTMEQIFSELKPEVVFHAAAHKHVPLMEENPAQAIFNNVMGTRNMVNLAVDCGVKHFVNVSTDKAVNPTSVMGASKRIAEHIVEWGADQIENGEVFVSVRFGNVLGSRGSVIPIFKDQIRRGGPVTITHPEMLRYFMTIAEASQLVLQAGALNNNGAVYVLDMGDPVNIEQMARDLIRLSGFKPDEEIGITHTGVRPGEKLFEELLTAEEGTDMTRHEKIFMARKNGVLPNLNERIDRLCEVAAEGDPFAIREEIHKIVPTYTGHRTAEA